MVDGVSDIDVDGLIATASATLFPHHTGKYQQGHVAAALVSAKGNVYRGVCIVLGSGMGFCAEHSAVAAMVTAREYEISAIVAVGLNDEGAVYVRPPCGRCREFMHQIDKANLDCAVILGHDNVVTLRELLPHSE